MYLKERLFGIIVYLAIFLFILMLLSKTTKPKRIKRILIMYLIFMGIMGYYYLPGETADLYRAQTLIKYEYSTYTFKQIFKIIEQINYQIYPLYYWVFGKIGNVKLLPAITGMWCYGNIFYILYDSYIREKWSNKTLINCVLFIIMGGQFLEVISGIRSMLAFSLVALCIYREIYKNKNIVKNIPIYIFAGLMHDAAFVLIGIRIAIMLIQKEKNFISYIKNILILIIIFIFVLKYGQNTINSILEHGSGYLNGNVYSNMWEYIVAISCDLIMIYSLKVSKTILNQIQNEEITIIRKISIIYLIIDIIFIIEYSIFHRFRSFVMFIMIPIIGYNFNFIEKNNGKYFKNYQKTFYLLIIFTILLTLVRGNISNLKFFLFD